MDVWNVEDELVAEQRWWRQRGARRELKNLRDEVTAKSIRHVEPVLVRWAMLLIASVAALIGSLVELVSGL
jgi:hypothetical protein